MCRMLRLDVISRPLVSQIVRSATSVGANYREANAASSPKDFRNKIYICKKELQETEHWIRMLRQCFPENKITFDQLQQECHELVLIFQKITTTMNRLDKVH